MEIDTFEDYLFQLIQQLIFYLRKIGASPQDAEDIAQDTLVKILEIEASLTHAELKPWIYRVGTNLLIDLQRKNKRWGEILQEHASFLWETFSQTGEVIDHDELYRVFHQLSQTQQRLLLLKYDQKLSYEAIGLILDQPKDSLKTELYRTRQKMRKLLEKEQRNEG